MSEIDDRWPAADEPTVVASAETVVAPPAPPPVEPLPPAAGPPPDRRIGAGMLLGILAILLVAAGVAVAWFLTHRGHSKTQPTTVLVTTNGTPSGGTARIAVPALAGQSIADAKTNLKQLGLSSSIRQVASTKPAGTVISQVPAAGTKLAKGGVVDLSVAKAAASQTTSSSGATTATTPTTTATTPTTTSAAPAQPQTATMPDVSNQSEVDAVQAIGQAGLLPSLAFVPSQDALGTVEGQAKTAGTQLPAKSHVQINLSTGPGTKTEEQVPNVVGQPLQAAVSAMQGAHLRLIYLRFPVTSQGQAGKIVQQSPLAGGQAPQNAQILVFLGALAK